MINKSTAIFPLAILLFLTGCGHDGVWQNARSVLLQQMAEKPTEVSQSREEINNIPYATISAQLEDLPPAVMVLGYVDNGRLQWISSDNMSVTTKAGRIVHTVGFEKDISYIEVIGKDFLDDELYNLKSSKTYQIIVESKTPSLASELLDCNVNYKSDEEIVILEYSYNTHLLEENCISTQGWKVKNLYWVDQNSRFVWRSQQGIVNGRYDIKINVLRPFG